VQFERGQGIDQVLHAQDRIGGVLAVRKAGDQFAEGIKRLAGAFRVAFGHVLIADRPEHAEVFVEVDQPAQVIHVVDIRVVRMQLDEAVAGGNRRRRLLVLPVGVGDVDLRLLRVATVGIARFELFEST
jgi:hypothetical protein